jgi:DNA-binding MarR family transcriptional regulator
MSEIATINSNLLPKLRRLLRALEPVQSELSLVQLMALCQIALEPGLSVNELADRLNCPQQSASRYVAALLGRYQGLNPDAPEDERYKLDPLIVQEISQADPRKRALYITVRGNAVLKTLFSKLDP